MKSVVINQTVRGALAIMLFALPGISNGNLQEDRQWDFRVFLDSKEIGYHRFEERTTSDQSLITSEASFKYKLLFLTLFTYEHDNLEKWNGNCLTSIEASTNNNGTQLRVNGSQVGNNFKVDNDREVQNLPSCVMTFAYWNPEFLKQQRLLNSQTGEFVKVDVSQPVNETIELNGRNESATRYTISGAELSIDLWYSGQNEWLALSSEVDGGRILRYERKKVM